MMCLVFPMCILTSCSSVWYVLMVFCYYGVWLCVVYDFFWLIDFVSDTVYVDLKYDDVLCFC